MRSDEEIERLLSDWLETEAHPLPPKVLESVLDAVLRVPQDASPHPRTFRFGSHAIGLVTAAAVVLLLAVAGGLAVDRIGPALLGSRSVPGMSGTWTSLDCATFWVERPDGTHLTDCDRWGDSSIQTLRIGRGDMPAVTFEDSDASSCASSSDPPLWLGSGTGKYEDIYLFVTLDEGACGTDQPATTLERQLYYDRGSDAMFEDEDGDGFGYVWRRLN